MLKIDDSQFQQWIKTVKIKMKEGLFDALIDAGLHIRDRTTPFVPLDRGYLERSYRQMIYTLTNAFIMEFGYSVWDNPWSRGYNYAWIQHEEPFNHPKRGSWKYLDTGMQLAEPRVFQIIETEFYKTLQ